MTDFVSLAAVSRAADFRGQQFSGLDLERLGNMLGHLRDKVSLIEAIPDGAVGVDRVRAAVRREKRSAQQARGGLLT